MRHLSFGHRVWDFAVLLPAPTAFSWSGDLLAISKVTKGKQKSGKHNLSAGAQAALAAARELADSHQQTLAPAHLFLALLDQGEISSYLTQNGIDLGEARLYAEAALPEAAVDDRALAKVLDFASYEVWGELGSEIRPRHLLVGLLRHQQWSDLPHVLESLGLNLTDLRNQIQAARRGNQKFATGHPLNQANGEAQVALDAAEAVMRTAYCGRINTLHLLLGLLNTAPNEAVAALERAGIDLAALKQAALSATAQDGEVAGPNRRFTPAAQRALDRARDLVERNGQRHWGTEHLLEALLPRPTSLKEAAREKLHYRGELEDPAAAVLEGVQPEFLRVEAAKPLSVSYTTGFEKAWAAAHVVAKHEGTSALTTSHLLCGIIVTPQSLAFEALQKSGLNLEPLQRRVPPDWSQQLKEAGERQERWHFPLTPFANQMVELAAKSAQANGFSHTGVEQLLFVLIKVSQLQPDSEIGQVLGHADLEAAAQFLEPHVLRPRVAPRRPGPHFYYKPAALSFGITFAALVPIVASSASRQNPLVGAGILILFLQMILTALTVPAILFNNRLKDTAFSYACGFVLGFVLGGSLLRMF